MLKQILNSSNTTVQENNTTFPTDSKLAKAAIDKCERMAHQFGIKQLKSYSRTAKLLLRNTHKAAFKLRTDSSGAAEVSTVWVACEEDCE